MKTFISKLAAASALLAFFSAPANAAVVLGGEDGWEVSYGGFVNLFYTQSDFKFIEPVNGSDSEDSSHLQEGLLPSFHTMTAKTPEVNGLKGTSQITFAVDTSSEKSSRLNKVGNIDLREVFFNVEGDFGTISVGRTLSLFQRQAILKDYTLFGMGALAGPDAGGTGLGRIGFGYVYPDFRTRFVYQTPDMNGFQLSVGIFDPQETATEVAETDTPQFQAEATYNTSFEGGSFSGWAGFLWQEQEITATNPLRNAANAIVCASGGDACKRTVNGMETSRGGTGDIESVGWNIGVDATMAGFNVAGHYYRGEALGSLLFNNGAGNGFNCHATACNEADNDGFYIQAGYTFNGATKIGGGFGKSRQDADLAYDIPKVENELWTVGVYHDVNPWLKVIAEYGNYESTQLNFRDVDTFSIGGFLLW